MAVLCSGECLRSGETLIRLSDGDRWFISGHETVGVEVMLRLERADTYRDIQME